MKIPILLSLISPCFALVGGEFTLCMVLFGCTPGTVGPVIGCPVGWATCNSMTSAEWKRMIEIIGNCTGPKCQPYFRDEDQARRFAQIDAELLAAGI